MNPTINYLADGDGIVGIIENAGGVLRAIAIAIAAVIFIAAGVCMLVGFFGQGKFRQHLSMIGVIMAACLLIGGGAWLGPALINTGEDIGGGGGGTPAVSNDGF
ncbi:MAG: hypothetical protein L0H59_00155 [Tomitella sp.]|nr:hypothetical protein [Tomitella sp.]